MSKICQTTKYKQRRRRGRGEEVVKRYEKSILGKSGTTKRLEIEGSGTKHPSRNMKSLPTPTFLRKDNHHTVPFISLCTLTIVPNITISTISNDQ